MAVAPVAAWTFLRLFGIDQGFPLATVMPFTPYVAVAALLVAGIAVALENWAAAALAALATFCLAVAVLPRAIGDGMVEAAGRERLEVLSTNILRGRAEPEAADRPPPGPSGAGPPLRARQRMTFWNFIQVS